MATNETDIATSSADVFAVLRDPSAYAYWVVGAKRIRSVDDGWPAPGTAFHHASGVGPMEIKDLTRVVEVDEPNHLLLEAGMRPFGWAFVDLRLDEREGGTTHVTLKEWPSRGLVARFGRLLDVLIHTRNVESLRRLKQVAEERARERPGASGGGVGQGGGA